MLMETQIRIIYPEDRWVNVDQVRLWAADIAANNDLPFDPNTLPDLETAVEILQDLGLVTFRKDWKTTL